MTRRASVLLLVAAVACVATLPPIPPPADPAVLAPEYPPFLARMGISTVVHFTVSLSAKGRPDVSTFALIPVDSSQHFAANAIATALRRWRPVVPRGTELVTDSVAFRIVPPGAERDAGCRGTPRRAVVCYASWDAVMLAAPPHPELYRQAATAILLPYSLVRRHRRPTMLNIEPGKISSADSAWAEGLVNSGAVSSVCHQANPNTCTNSAGWLVIDVGSPHLVSPDTMLIPMGAGFSCQDDYQEIMLAIRRGTKWIEEGPVGSEMAGTPWCRVPVAEEPSPAPWWPRRGLRSEMLGCFALSVVDSGISGGYYRATRTVRLDSTAGRDLVPFHGTFRFLVRYDSLGHAVDALKSRRRWDGVAPAWWADTLDDSVRLDFSDGLSGAEFAFLASPGTALDTLRGWVANNWDFGPPFQTDRRAARAVRVACPTR
jgi:hypothetical protein